MVSMTSFEILPLNPNEGAQDLSSNFTFIQDVVIPHPEPIQNGYASSEWDSLLNERLEKLLDENTKLKEKIQLSNRMIPELLDTITRLREMVETNSKCQSMLTFAETDKQELQEQNEELSKKVEELSDKVKDLENTLDQRKKLEELLKKEVLEITSDKTKLNEMIKDQEAMLELLELEKEKLASELGNLQIEFKLLEEEKDDFKSAYLSLQEKDQERKSAPACDDLHIVDDANGYAIIMQPEKTENKRADEIEQVDSSRLEAQLSKSQVEHLSLQLDEEIHMGKNLMQLLGEKDAEVQKLKEAIEKMTTEGVNDPTKDKQLSEVNEKLSSTISLMEECKLKTEYSMLLVSELQEKVKQTEEFLMVEKENSQKAKEALSEAEKMLHEVRAEKEQMSLLLDERSYECAKEEEEMSLAQAQMEQQSLIKLDGLTAKICYLEEELEMERQNVARLTRQSTSSDGESESVRILKTQINMYKSDYECEKSARESAQEEVEKLKETVNNLQKKLQGKSSKSHEAGGHGSRRRMKHGNSRLSEPPIMNNHSSSIPCPCCGSMYFAYADLERHVLECSDNHRD